MSIVIKPHTLTKSPLFESLPRQLHILYTLCHNYSYFLVPLHDFNKAEKEAKRKYNTKLKEDLTNSNLSTKKWWRVVNSLAGKAAHSDIPVIVHDDVAHITDKEKANIFSPHLVDSPTIIPSIDIIFKPKIIKQLLKQLVPDKATG